MNNPIDNLNFSILECIYHNQYIPFSELSGRFPHVINLADIIFSFDLNKYVSFRSASCAEEDEGYETGYLKQDSHLVTLPAGNAIIEDAYRHKEELKAYSGYAHPI